MNRCRWNRIERCLLAVIAVCVALTICAQCYHAGYRAAVAAHGECEANQE